MKTELKKLRRLKSYGQIKIDSENMAVSFVFWPHFSQNLKRKVATFLMHYFFTSLSFCVQNGQQNGMKVRNKWFSNNLEIQDTLLSCPCHFPQCTLTGTCGTKVDVLLLETE